MVERKFIIAIRNSWDEQTCYPRVKSEWGCGVPELGQCAVTALLINDRYGGHILYNAEYDHYWNLLPGGKNIDLTKNQFQHKKILSGVSVTRNYLLHSNAAKKFYTDRRYQLLKKRVSSFLI
jgi:hypothetical protein